MTNSTISNLLEELNTDYALTHSSFFQDSISKIQPIEKSIKSLLTNEIVEAIDWFIDMDETYNDIDLIDARNDINAFSQFIGNLSQGAFSMTEANLFARLGRHRNTYQDISEQLKDLTNQVQELFKQNNDRPESVMKAILEKQKN